jgi:Mg-chelatase subunit ChlD
MKTNEMTKTQVYNLVILDKSGSMESIRKEAVDGYNETLGTIRAAQQKHADTQEQYVSLAAFCGCGVEMIYDKTPIDQAAKLEPNQYEPCCVTPLFDAIGSTIKKLKHDIKDVADAAVLVTIITDGCENASKEWTGPAIKKLIDECKQDGWMFAFIGAGEDIVQVASTISITNTVVWEKSTEGTEAMFAMNNDASARFYDKMAAPCCVGASVSERKKMRRQFSEDYYGA